MDIAIFVLAIIIGIIISLISIIGIWYMYEKADEHGWAYMIPFYDTWVLARIAGYPEWWGLILWVNVIKSTGIEGNHIVSALTVILQTISLIMFLIISFGLARRFNKGVLFGIGLCFLPFIFYPILGYGEAKYRFKTFNDHWICNKCGNNNTVDHIQCWKCGNPSPNQSTTK